MKIGDTLGFKVTGLDTGGNPFTLTNENVVIALSDNTLGTVAPHPDGVAYHYLFTAAAAGTEDFTASDPDLPDVKPGTLEEVIAPSLGALEIVLD